MPDLRPAAMAQVFEGRVVRGDPNACGHIIQASGGSGANRQTINFTTERVVGNGSFGVVFQATCLETGETVWLGRQSFATPQTRASAIAAHRHPRVVPTVFICGHQCSTVQGPL